MNLSGRLALHSHPCYSHILIARWVGDRFIDPALLLLFRSAMQETVDQPAVHSSSFKLDSFFR